ncbi:hypothetical protein FB45DRAFT_1098648 [Roridomyces roridus]|uniref:F-box domain-containing protein n=1 Tax=Roridomyces roridus TaxID=1738132 RepID=A0AAD7FYK4_9AGAR|nr:hypothetical protein FB45DRAFT_1098648 [Roridomyces roridus]
MMSPSTSSPFVPAAARARIAQLNRAQHPLSYSKLLERDTLQKALKNYKYPVLTLPSEVTSEIFVHFLPSYPKRTSFVGRCSPSLLLQVCREWRDVALATPELWSTFEVEMGYRDTSAVSTRRQLLLVEWLERSKDCPLSVELVCPTSESPAIAAALLDALVHHSHRWQDMKLVIAYQHLQRIAGSVPILRDLHLDAEWTDNPSPLQSFTFHAPSLRQLGLNAGVHFNTFKDVFPWSLITVFNGDLYEHEAALVLRSARALEQCKIMIDSESEETISVSPIPPLHHLKSLTLESEDAFKGHCWRMAIRVC